MYRKQSRYIYGSRYLYIAAVKYAQGCVETNGPFVCIKVRVVLFTVKYLLKMLETSRGSFVVLLSFRCFREDTTIDFFPLVVD